MLLVAVGCGSGAETTGPATPGPPRAGPANEPPEVAARWEPVARFAGSGDQRTAGFDIAPHAIQWRVTASCAGTAVRVSLAAEPAALVEPVCPGRGFGFSIRTGPNALDVSATGGWEVIIDQQVDTPIAEPRLAGMSERSRRATGEFYGIDQTASGTAALYRLPDGGRALRFEPFHVTANTDLFVWVSAAERPRTSEEALLAPHVQIDGLKATAGAQNYRLPDDIPAEQLRSVVVWCEPVRTAYAAATLSR